MFAEANPTLTINNVGIGYVPNSLVPKLGLGESKVRSQTTGGNNMTSVHSEDLESKVSMVKFTIYPTADNIALLKGWKANNPNNAITLSSNRSSLSINFSKMSMTNDPEIPMGVDTTIDIEFSGPPAI